jgi:regulator of sigma E protease
LDFIIWLYTNALGLLGVLLPFFLVLTVIVFVHEMGHYLVARWNGISIKTFSIGFGREIAGFTDRHGTRWRLSMIPLGGYVRFEGDMNAASVPDSEMLAEVGEAERSRLFYYKNVWQRIAVIVAGPLANFIFTFLVLYVMLVSVDRFTLSPVIDVVQDGRPAAEAGLLPGDRIISVDGYPVRGFEDFQRLIATSPEREVKIVISRGASELEVSAVPEAVERTDRFGNPMRIGMLGVSRNTTREDVEIYRPDPISAIPMAAEEMVFIVDRTFAFLGDFFVGRGDREQLGGPVKVAQISGEVAGLGLLALINLMALLSLNIGLFNLFPIPMLDGGHLLFYLIEAVRGRPLSQRVQDMGFKIGLALVVTLMVATLINDLV